MRFKAIRKQRLKLLAMAFDQYLHSRNYLSDFTMYYHSGPTSTPFPDVPAFPTPPQPAYLRPPPAYLPPPAPGYPGHASGSCWPPTPGFLPLVTARAGRAAGGPASCRARLGSAGSSQSLSTDDSEEDGTREATYTHLTRNPVSDLAR